MKLQSIQSVLRMALLCGCGLLAVFSQIVSASAPVSAPGITCSQANLPPNATSFIRAKFTSSPQSELPPLVCVYQGTGNQIVVPHYNVLPPTKTSTSWHCGPADSGSGQVCYCRGVCSVNTKS